ncbi:hypothetical protein GCM10007859_08130 [Brevundimonas denitrificans]|uniref:Uncharacterized protein n=1 Tax=Brevundimonas denitrificans TaxID=1443434 RepID=A0ABQ6BM00_9CAUL|nr:hypothetical protein [Brevundimonas denitrificans]GLS00804.1 hypothetical protein GCM10007859_08130 [Brevundimonas denitrificans]
MTEDTPKMSPAEAAGRAMVARTSFEKEAVWLPVLAVNHWNAGEMVITGKTFTDCVIEGPAVMAVMNGTTFDGCNMGAAANPRNLLLKPLGDKIVGAIGMADCRFVRCRFAQVAFTGDDALLAELESGISAGNSAMEQAGGDAA